MIPSKNQKTLSKTSKDVEIIYVFTPRETGAAVAIQSRKECK